MIRQTTRTKMRLAVVTIGMTLLVTGSGCDSMVGVSGANSVTTVTRRPASKEAVAGPSTAVATPGTSVEAAAGGVGTLKGRVVYGGSGTPLAPLFAKGTATKDPSICGAEAILNETILVKDGGLANVFVYLDKIPKGATIPPPGPPILFDQKVCVFTPHAMVVRVNQPLKILNADAAAHNTHTYPKKNTGFNSVVQPNDRTGVDLTYGLAEKEPLSVGCDIHPWMKAYHLPLEHPFGAVSAADGTFEIKDLPAGKHEFKVWHEAGEMIEKAFAVTIKPGDNEVTINVPASKLGK